MFFTYHEVPQKLDQQPATLTMQKAAAFDQMWPTLAKLFAKCSLIGDMQTNTDSSYTDKYQLHEVTPGLPHECGPSAPIKPFARIDADNYIGLDTGISPCISTNPETPRTAADYNQSPWIPNLQEPFDSQTNDKLARTAHLKVCMEILALDIAKAQYLLKTHTDDLNALDAEY